MATMSLLGLYHHNPGLFGELTIPEGLEKDVLVDNLLAETAELEVIYPDPIFMQAMIGRWSLKELSQWERYYRAMSAEYNPIENYNRTERWVDKTTTKENAYTTLEGNSSTQFEGETSADGTDSGTVEKKVSAYNETTYTPAEQTTEDQDHDSHQTSESTTKGKTSQDQTENRNRNDEAVREGNASGNIGGTTSQSMLMQELEVARNNTYDFIIESFKCRFCLMVY